MATFNGKAPKHGGSHFGTAKNGSSREAPASSTGAMAPRSALSGGTVSHRTAAATKRAGAGKVRRASGTGGGGRVAALVGVLLACAVVAGLVFLVVIPSLNVPQQDEETQTVVPGNQVTITIPEGSAAGDVAQILYDNGIIASKSEFLSQARRTESESSIKSGAYSITTGSDLADIVTLLTTGPNVKTAQITIPEGYTISQIASAVEQSLGVSAADFTAQAKASNYVSEFVFLSDVTNDSLEGYLFPKTYDFSSEVEVTADTVIRAMLSQYQTEVSSIDFTAACAQIQERYGVTVNEDDIITMASIIEREAGGDEHRGDVASVFYNRLQAGMMLQSDATLVYSLGRDVTADDLTMDDPYNTYTNYGLTPTPICSPGLASIQAAAYPNDTGYYYFFLSGDYAAFSETLDEHNLAIANRPQ